TARTPNHTAGNNTATVSSSAAPSSRGLFSNASPGGWTPGVSIWSTMTIGTTSTMPATSVTSTISGSASSGFHHRHRSVRTGRGHGEAGSGRPVVIFGAQYGGGQYGGGHWYTW